MMEMKYKKKTVVFSVLIAFEKKDRMEINQFIKKIICAFFFSLLGDISKCRKQVLHLANEDSQAFVLTSAFNP